jgi:hypothetical protein
MTQYRVRICLTPLPAAMNPMVIETLFDGAIRRNQRLKEAALSRAVLDVSEPNTKANSQAYIEQLTMKIIQLSLAKGTATVTALPAGAELSFNLPLHDEGGSSYHEVSDEGMKRWVRQEFEDIFLNSMTLLKFDAANESKGPIYAALDNAFLDANKADAQLFSIDGERPSGLESRAPWICLFDEPSIPAAIEKLRSFLAEHPILQSREPNKSYNIMTLGGMAKVPSGQAREVLLQEVEAILKPLEQVFNMEVPEEFTKVSDMLDVNEMTWGDDGLGHNILSCILPTGEEVFIPT